MGNSKDQPIRHFPLPKSAGGGSSLKSSTRASRRFSLRKQVLICDDFLTFSQSSVKTVKIDTEII